MKDFVSLTFNISDDWNRFSVASFFAVPAGE
jgi:hypothetical protein